MAALKEFLKKATPAESPLVPMSPRLRDAFCVSSALVLFSFPLWVSLSVSIPVWWFWLDPTLAAFLAVVNLATLVSAVYLLISSRLFTETSEVHHYQAYGTVIVGGLNAIAMVTLIALAVLFFVICAVLLIALISAFSSTRR